MPMILYLCHNCGVPVSPEDDECINCTAPKDGDRRGWIQAVLTDEDGVRLQAAAGVMLDMKP